MVHPVPRLGHAESSAVDRKLGVPVTERFPDVVFPDLQRPY